MINPKLQPEYAQVCMGTTRVLGGVALTDPDGRIAAITDRQARPDSFVNGNTHRHLVLLKLHHENDAWVEDAIAVAAKELARHISGTSGDDDLVALVSCDGFNGAEQSGGYALVTGLGLNSYAMDTHNPALNGVRVLYSAVDDCVVSGLYVGADETGSYQLAFAPCSEYSPFLRHVRIGAQWWRRYGAGLGDVFGQQINQGLVVSLRRGEANHEVPAASKETTNAVSHAERFYLPGGDR